MNSILVETNSWSGSIPWRRILMTVTLLAGAILIFQPDVHAAEVKTQVGGEGF